MAQRGAGPRVRRPTRSSSSAPTPSTSWTTARWSTPTSVGRRGHDGDHRGRRGRRLPLRDRAGRRRRRSPTTPTSPTNRRRRPRPTRSSCSRPTRRSTGSRRSRTTRARTGSRTSATSCSRTREDGLARGYPLEGYWRDVGTMPAYWQAHRDFLSEEPPIDLDDPAWPVHTRGGRHSAARIRRRGGRGEPDLGGTRVAGRCAARCCRRAWCGGGRPVVDSVLLPGRRARGRHGDPRRPGRPGGGRPRSGSAVGTATSRSSGRQAAVAAGTEVAAGARLPEED